MKRKKYKLNDMYMKKEKYISFYRPDGTHIKTRPLAMIDCTNKYTTLVMLEEGLYRHLWGVMRVQDVSIDGNTGEVQITYEGGNYLIVHTDRRWLMMPDDITVGDVPRDLGYCPAYSD